jgi:ATP-dependent helicase/DNAse subunit B
VPLRLVTGPANAAKAGAVLGTLRERLADEPLLVVPAFEDVEHNQRELAARGAVFGARVVRPAALFREIALRAGYRARVASALQRRLIFERAVAASDLEAVAASAERPGFARAGVRFVEELERSMVEPQRLTVALRQWAGEGPRARYAEEVAEIYRRYRAGLDAAELVDEDLFAWRALDALRREPASWGGTPVFVYGFDDFGPLERDALETLATHARVDVTVSLPYEPGRHAFKGTAGIREHLAALADTVEHLEAVSDHYDPDARAALHALERGLYEDQPEQADPGGAVRLHVAGGERAEVELCAGEILALLRAGADPGDVAVVFRDPDDYGSVVEQVFGAYGIPYSIDRSVPLAHTGLGRGLLALLRCAEGRGSADDVLAYLRTPGRLRVPLYADKLEAEVRRRGITAAGGAIAVWNDDIGPFPLDEVERLAAARDMPELLALVGRRLERLLAGPYERSAHVLEGAELDDARAFRAAHEAVRELHALALSDPAALDRRRLHDMLAELPVRTGENPQPDRVQIASPLGVRARRFDAVFVCGLQEGEFPRPAGTEPFLSDVDRGDLAAASGLVLARREDQLERERYLFYVCASRAEKLLVLSTRTSDEDGNPQPRSFLVDEVERIFPRLAESPVERSLSAVTWEPADAPTDAEWGRAVAWRGERRRPGVVGPVIQPAALAVLAGRETVSAGALEHFAGCPVRWLVDDLLRPEKLEPDPEPMVRGSYAHSVLEVTLRKLREQTGDRRVTPSNLALAEELMLDALVSQQGEYRLAPNQTRVRAAVRRLEFDLLRYLRHEAETDSLYEPEHLEFRFGFADCDHPAVELDGQRVRGIVDRVDVHGKRALVRDYKSGRVLSYKLADWEREGRIQAGLYMLVVEELLGLEPAAGLYTPLGGQDRRSRGLVRGDLADEVGSDVVSNDLVEEDEFGAHLDRVRDRVGEVAGAMREGRLESCPATCAYRGGCSYPTICRVEA